MNPGSNPPRGIGPSRGPQRQPGARENPGTSYADSPPRGAGTRDPRRLPGAGENPDGTSYTGNPSRGTGRVTRDPRRLTGTGGNPGTSYARNPQRGARATMVLRRPLGAGGRIARGGGRIDRGKTRKYYKGRETGYRGVRGGQGAEGWNKGHSYRRKRSGVRVRERQEYFEYLEQQQQLLEKEEEKKSSSRLANLLFDLSESCASKIITNSNGGLHKGNFRVDPTVNYKGIDVKKKEKPNYQRYDNKFDYQRYDKFDHGNQETAEYSECFDDLNSTYYQENEYADEDINPVEVGEPKDPEISEMDEIVNVIFPLNSEVKRRRSF